jgi:hypothetical protein
LLVVGVDILEADNAVNWNPDRAATWVASSNLSSARRVWVSILGANGVLLSKAERDVHGATATCIVLLGAFNELLLAQRD